MGTKQMCCVWVRVSFFLRFGYSLRHVLRCRVSGLDQNFAANPYELCIYI